MATRLTDVDNTQSQVVALSVEKNVLTLLLSQSTPNKLSNDNLLLEDPLHPLETEHLTGLVQEWNEGLLGCTRNLCMNKKNPLFLSVGTTTGVRDEVTWTW